MQRDERRVGPVEQPRRQPAMLPERQPVPDRVGVTLVIRVFAEVPEEVELEALDSGLVRPRDAAAGSISPRTPASGRETRKASGSARATAFHDPAYSASSSSLQVEGCNGLRVHGSGFTGSRFSVQKYHFAVAFGRFTVRLQACHYVSDAVRAFVVALARSARRCCRPAQQRADLRSRGSDHRRPAASDGDRSGHRAVARRKISGANRARSIARARRSTASSRSIPTR